jgi:hypothetical protein
VSCQKFLKTWIKKLNRSLFRRPDGKTLHPLCVRAVR